MVGDAGLPYRPCTSCEQATCASIIPQHLCIRSMFFIFSSLHTIKREWSLDVWFLDYVIFLLKRFITELCCCGIFFFHTFCLIKFLDSSLFSFLYFLQIHLFLTSSGPSTHLFHPEYALLFTLYRKPSCSS